MPQEKPQASREIALNLTPEELGEWKQHPATLEVLRFLREVREDYREQLCRGETWNPQSVEQTAQLTSRLLGQIYALNLIVAIRSPEPESETPRKTGYEPTV